MMINSVVAWFRLAAKLELLLLEANLFLSELLNADLLGRGCTAPRGFLITNLKLEQATCTVRFPLKKALSATTGLM